MCVHQGIKIAHVSLFSMQIPYIKSDCPDFDFLHFLGIKSESNL